MQSAIFLACTSTIPLPHCFITPPPSPAANLTFIWAAVDPDPDSGSCRSQIPAETNEACAERAHLRVLQRWSVVCDSPSSPGAWQALSYSRHSWIQPHISLPPLLWQPVSPSSNFALFSVIAYFVPSFVQVWQRLYPEPLGSCSSTASFRGPTCCATMTPSLFCWVCYCATAINRWILKFLIFCVWSV